MNSIKQSVLKTIKTTLVISALAVPFVAQAKDISVTITNLTNGIYFTPLFVSAHSQELDFFELGEVASEHLQAMAEGGDFSGLSEDAKEYDADVSEDPAGGLLAPGATATAELDDLSRKNKYLSVTAMLLPTNDGFVAADSIRIPNKKGSYTFYLKGYDAGTEANDEIINGGGAPNNPGIPADPGGNNGSGASGVTSVEHNNTVHIHRGIVGDTFVDGGISDLDTAVHRWHNPVAKMVITVNCKNSHYNSRQCR